MTHIVDADAASARLALTLQQERERRGWSQTELAEHSGVSKASISKIERGEMSPTAALLVRLAGAFELTLAGLLLRAEGQPGRLSRAGQQPRWRDPETGYQRQQIFMQPDFPLEAVQISLPARQQVSLPASSYARIRQMVWVQQGQLIIQEGTQRHEMNTGDALAFGPPQDVTFANETAQPCTYLVLLTRS